MENFKNEIVRALWWKQPYASAMLLGKIETRTWPTKVRGKVLICASVNSYAFKETQTISGKMFPFLVTEMVFSQIPKDIIDLCGHAIAIGDLVDCRPMVKEDERQTYVQYREGLWCHIYENVQAIEPFPLKGAQGWRILTEEQKELIKIL